MREPTSLVARLRQAVADAPRRVALVAEDGATLTVADWARRSQALAGGLRQAGVADGQRVVVRLPAGRWIEAAVACLGVQQATATAVPLPAHLSEHELARILADADPAAVIAPPELAGDDPPVAAHTVEALEAAGAHQPVSAPGEPDAPAEVCYRSRPLSHPTPIVASHRQLATSAWTAPPVGDAAASLVHPFPMGTPAGQGALAAALGPTPLTVAPLARLERDRLAAVVAAADRPACALAPAAAHALLEAGAADRELADIAALVLAGGRVTGELLARLTLALPRARLGLIDVLDEPDDVAAAAFAHEPTRPGALGKPVTSDGVWVGDDAGEAVESGELARVWRRGSGGQPVATATAAYADPDGLIHPVTGTHATIGRRDGTRLDRGELAAVLAAHPGVADAAAVGAPSEQAADTVAAAVVAHPGRTLDLAQLHIHLADHLDAAHRPDRLTPVDRVPRNAAGLLQPHQLRDQLDLPTGPPPAPGLASHTSACDGEPADHATADPAADEREATIGGQVSRVLGVAEPGRHDDVFALGAGWLAVVRLLALVRDAFGVTAPRDAFVAEPTVAGLAACVARRRPSQPAAGDPLSAGTAHVDAHGRRIAPLEAAQHGMLWHERFAPGCQNLPGLARRFRGPLDVAALEAALNDLVAAHEALRTTFEVRGGEPVQIVHPHRPRRLPVVDLGELPAADADARVTQMIADAGARPHDLVAGPLFTATLVRLAADDHVLVLRTHHLVFDDWSVAVFRRQLAAGYAAHTGADTAAPSVPATQPADFAASQRHQLAGAHGARQLAYWRDQLAGAPWITQLPVDDPDRPAGSPQPSGQPLTVTLPAAVRDGLEDVARSRRASLFQATLAAVAVLASRYTGQDDLVLATVVAHRNRADLEGVIGCFAKKVPLRLSLADDPSFGELVRRARTGILGALAHQDPAFDDIVQHTLGPPAAAHGLTPHLALMVQGVTSPPDLAMPGVDSAGYDTSATTTRTHFSAGDAGGQGDAGADGDAEADGDAARAQPCDRDDGHAGELPWGCGVYRGTFVILSIADTGETVTCSTRGAYHAPAMRDVLDHLPAVAADLAAHPDQPVSRAALVHEPEPTGRPVPPAPAQPAAVDTALAAWRQRVARHRDAPAVAGATETVTYGELEARANRLAARLAGAGAGRDHPVGVALAPSVELIAAVLAAWKAGAAWLPVTGHGPADGHAAGASHAAEPDTAPAVVVASEADHGLGHQAPVVAPPGPDDEHPRDDDVDHAGDPDGADAAVLSPAPGHPPASASPTAPARWMTHEAVAALVAALADDEADEGARTRRWGMCPAASDIGFVCQLARLLAGQPLSIPEPGRGEPHQLLAMLAAGEIDSVAAGPAAFDALCRAGLGDALERRPAASPRPRLIVAAGGPLGPDRWQALTRLASAPVTVIHALAAGGLAGLIHPHLTGDSRWDSGWPTHGRPAVVLDRHGRPQPDRAVGELHVASRAPASTPRHDTGDPPGATPHGPEGLIATGRRARRLPDGRVELLGDADTDLAGAPLDHAAIARALSACPGVSHATVTGDHDPTGDAHLTAHVTVTGATPPAPSELRAGLWARLPGHAWPASLDIATFHTGAGSERDDHVPASAAPPSNGVSAPSASAPSPSASPAPASPLGPAWAEVLGVDHLAATSNYWQAFSVLEALARARDAGVVVDARQVTRHRTLAGLDRDPANASPGSSWVQVAADDR